jgi:lysophospholipase L1-like esterase
MRTVVCFGDSNTWGYDPATDGRHGHEIRWPGAMRAALGGDYWVIEEGLGGRTTVFEDPLEPGRRGIDYLYPCLRSHRPLELVIIMLGTNDLKARFGVPASDVALGAEMLVRTALQSESGPGDGAPLVLLVAPPPFAPLPPTRFNHMFAGGEEKSHLLAGEYAKVAALHNVGFFDAGSVITSSPLDAIHFEADAQQTLGRALAVEVKRMLG